MQREYSLREFVYLAVVHAFSLKVGWTLDRSFSQVVKSGE